MALLNVKNLKKDFGRQHVLKGVDFSMEEGEVLSIIGPSGGGKTTLLRCLNLLEIPTDGIVTVGNQTIFDAAETRKLSDEEMRKRRQHFGLVFQNFNLFPQYTALGNVSLAPKLQKLGSEAEIREKCEDILARVGLFEHMNKYPHQLSGGQQQRVAIARALALSPEILFFDEPTSALDPELTGEVLKVIRQLADEKTTMVIVTHEMGFARQVSSQVMFICDGVVAEKGTPEEIFDDPTNARMAAFIGKVANKE